MAYNGRVAGILVNKRDSGNVFGYGGVDVSDETLIAYRKASRELKRKTVRKRWVDWGDQEESDSLSES